MGGLAGWPGRPSRMLHAELRRRRDAQGRWKWGCTTLEGFGNTEHVGMG